MNPASDHIRRIAPGLFPALLALVLSATGAPAQQPGARPVKIFIVAGQSNMQGHGNMTPVTTPGTLEHTVANDPAGNYQFVSDGGGWTVWDDVWIHYERGVSNLLTGNLTAGYGASDTTIGPEVGFGSVVGDHYSSQVLLIKTAWGGKSLAVDFRPPSSGGTTGFYYNEILRLVQDATTNLGTYFPGYQGQGYEIAGIGWHQGWNDRVDQARNDEYEVNMANFIRDIRVDLGIADLPVVIATTGMSGWDETHPRALSLMNAQLAVAQYPEFQGNVFTVETRGFYRDVAASPANQSYHWNRNAATYLDIGVAMGEAMTILAPDQCPSRLQATGGTDGVTLTWLNGENTPASVRILRNSVEIASAAPVDPPTFLDAGALPGVYDYELIFTMPGDPPTACDPLTLRFDGCVGDLEAVRYPSGVVLTWTNGMPFDGIEIRRGGTVLEGSLSGTADSFTDTSPPAGGLVTYSVTPTNGSCPPATVEIDFDTVPAGRALIYEPFDYAPGGLDQKSGNSEVGLQDPWNADASTQVAAGTLAFGGLPVGGGKLADFSAGQNLFGGSRGIRPAALADRGLLDDGATLWFSALMGADTGGNITSARLVLALANSQFNDGSGKYWIDDEGGQAGSGLGLTLGRFSGMNATPVATRFRDLASGDGTRGNIYGDVSGSGYGAGEHGLIVGTFTWGATVGDPDVITIYQPGPDLVLPAAPVSTLSTTVDQSAYDTITFARGDKVVLDEIRFGAVYGDVVGAGGPVSDYDTWAGNFPGVDLSDPGADLDGDGLSHDEERIWGLDPVNASERNPIRSAIGPAGGFSYTRRDPALTGLAFTVWTSTDLLAWTEDTGADQTPGGPGGNDVQTVAVVLSPGLLADPRLFVQVRAGE